MEKVYMRYGAEDGSFHINHNVTSGEGCNAFMHNHRQYEIFVLMSEQASFTVEGSVHRLRRGDMMIFNSRELHKVSYDGDKPYERYVIHFNKELVLPFCSEKFHLLKAFENRGLGMYNRIAASVAQQENIADYLNKLKICLLGTHLGRDVMMKCYLIQMLVSINRVIDEKVQTAGRVESEDKISAILKYINDHLDAELTLDGLSEQFFISKYHMSHLFKNITGYSISQYIALKRILLADELISEGVAAAEACEAAGFNDYSNFYKSFCKLLGRPPKYSQSKTEKEVNQMDFCD